MRDRHPGVDAATLAELRKEFEQLQIKNTSDSMHDLPGIYARYFTAQELRDMTAFYRTPTGAKTLTVMPQVTVEFTANLMPRMQANYAEFTRAAADRLQRFPMGSASSNHVLGSLDFSVYCRAIHGGRTPARLVGNDINGWRCVAASGLQGINVDDACRRQYGNSNATARFQNFNDPNSWVCVNQ